MSNEKQQPHNDDTVGQVGSKIDGGGLDDPQQNESLVTSKDLKGKKVDADPADPAQQPADQ